MTNKIYNSDTEKQGNPFKKHSHSYGIVELFHATTVIRNVDGTGNPIWDFGDGGKSKVKPRINKKFDYNVFQKLPDAVRDMPPQQRQECAIDVFYEWKLPIGNQTQDTLKVTDLLMRTEKPDTPHVARLKQERAVEHPELFDSAGNPHSDEPFHAEPIVNPNPMSAEELEARLAKTREIEAQMKATAKAEHPQENELEATVKSDKNSDAGQPDDKPQSDPPETSDLDNFFPRWSATKEPTLEKQIFSARGHFERELNAIGAIGEGGWDVGARVRESLGADLATYIGVHGIGSTCHALQDHLDYLKERPVVTTPTNTTSDDELTAHWSTVDANMQTIKLNLEREAEQLGISPSAILTEALNTLGLTRWEDCPKGSVALATVRSAWREKIAQQASQSDDSEASAPTGRDEPTAPAQTAKASAEPATEKAPDKFEIDPFLLGAKTLTGIPAMRIQEFVNRPYEPWAKTTTKEAFGTATVIDPLAVRQRFDKIFGPHGIGWHIIPVENGASTILTPFTQHTSKGERDMYQLTLSGYVMEYRLRIGDSIEWQRTSAFTDSNDSEDAGYAGGGAFSSLMKQALKMLGGYDHFIIPEKKRKAGQAA